MFCQYDMLSYKQEKVQKGNPRCTGNCEHKKMHQPYSISSPSRTNLEYCTIQTGKQEWAPHKNLLSSSEFESFETGLNTNLLSVHRLVRSNMYRIATAPLHAIGMWSTAWMSPASIPQDRKNGQERLGIWHLSQSNQETEWLLHETSDSYLLHPRCCRQS